MGWTIELGKLSPFLLSQYFYWDLFSLPYNEESLKAVFFKCLPLSILIIYVFLSASRYNGPQKFLVNNFLFGLIFSILGDMLLVYRAYFIHGLIAFAVGHLFYIRGMGFNPLKLGTGFIILMIAVPMMTFIVPKISDPIIKYAAPIYGILLYLDLWRSAARISNLATFLSFLGFISFTLSDYSIIWHTFYKPMSGNYAQIQIMSTYYLAQFLIILTVVDIFVSFQKNKKSK